MKVKEGRGSGAVVLSLALGGMGSVARAGDEMGLVVLELASDGMVSAGDGGRAGGAALDGTCGGGGQGRRGDHNARALVGGVEAAEEWIGGGD